MEKQLQLLISSYETKIGHYIKKIDKFNHMQVTFILGEKA